MKVAKLLLLLSIESVRENMGEGSRFDAVDVEGRCFHICIFAHLTGTFPNKAIEPIL